MLRLRFRDIHRAWVACISPHLNSRSGGEVEGAVLANLLPLRKVLLWLAWPASSSAGMVTAP